LNPTGLVETTKGEQGRQGEPDEAQPPMHESLEPFAAPQGGFVHEPLAIEPNGPESGEGPGDPQAGPGGLEEDARLDEAGQTHEGEDEANEEGVDAKDRAIHGCEAGGFFAPVQMTGDEHVHDGENEQADAGEAKREGERWNH